MATYPIPFFAFVAATLAMLLAHGVWSRFFDRRSRAKKQRVQAVYDAVHANGHSPGSAHAARQGGALETWLRSRSGIFGRFESLVRRAHVPLTAGRLLALTSTLFTVLLGLGLLRRANGLTLLALAAVSAGTPLMWLRRKADRYCSGFGDKLPETLDYISRALRAGHSLTSAIGMVGREFPGPVGQEFKTVFDEIGFGIPFKEALRQLANRVRSSDLDFFVISLMIQHDTGGNLTELLDGLAGTMRERVKLRGKIRTLSSEGRASAWVLGSMPFMFAGIIMLINPGYISILWTTPQGRNLLLIGGGLMAAGFFLLNRIVQIKV